MPGTFESASKITMQRTVESQTQPGLTSNERETHIFLLHRFYQLLKVGKVEEAEQILKAAEAVLNNRGL